MSSDIFAVKQWTDCLSDNKGKRPKINPAKPTSALTYDNAVLASQTSEASKYYGFIFSKNDPFIGLDVDVDPTGAKQNASLEIPQPLLLFLATHPTHVHYSPSGQGIHIIYKLNARACDHLINNSYKQGACSISNGALFDGDWRWDRSFLTFTKNYHELHTDKIATVGLDELEEVLGSLSSKASSVSSGQETPDSNIVDLKSRLKIQSHIPSIKELAGTLADVPSSFTVHAKKAIAHLKHSQPQSNYDYWLLVGQACASTALELKPFGTHPSDVCKLFHAWSKQDPGYVSRQDVYDKFDSLLLSTLAKVEQNEHVATYSVLLSLARAAVLDFPDRRGKGLLPDPASIRNYEYLFAFEGLTLWQDTMAGGFTFRGPEETIAKWFCIRKEYVLPRAEGISQVIDLNNVATVMLPFIQNKFKQPVGPEKATMAAKHFISQAQVTNTFKDWIDSKPWDGVPRFESVCKSIEFSNSEYTTMYEGYIRKSLLAMIGIHYFQQDHPKIPAMLVLKGPQNTYKSSWAEWLLPPELTHFLGMGDVETMIAGGVERDRLLATRAVVVINECEPLFNPRYEQRIKSSVDQEIVTYRDLYASSPISRQRTALIIGTTNKSDLYTGALGTRKIWQIPVTVCDSMLIHNMDKQQLYAEIKHILHEAKKRNPKMLIQSMWNQSTAEIAIIEEMNRQSRGTVGIDALLVETFGDPVEMEFNPNEYISDINTLEFRFGDAYSQANKPNAWRITQLLRFMRERYPDDMIDRKQLSFAAMRYCEVYTQTQNAVRKRFANVKKAKPVERGCVQLSKSDRVFLFPTFGAKMPIAPPEAFE
jgi:hypothetical protein